AASGFSGLSATSSTSSTSAVSATSAVDAWEPDGPQFASAPLQIPPSYPPRRMLRNPLITGDTPIGDEIAASLDGVRPPGGAQPASGAPGQGAPGLATPGPPGAAPGAPPPPPPHGAPTPADASTAASRGARTERREVRRTSTTTGRRVGAVSWPLLALLLLLLAVFGASLATRLLGAGESDVTGTRVTIASPVVSVAPTEAPWVG